MLYRTYKAYVNFEKEEKWLNEMAAKGMNLIHYSVLSYLFKEGEPGEYIYRIELLKEMPNHPESKAYIRFMEESGVELVSTYFRWAYFRKKASDGPFELYTDADSKINHYKRIAVFTGVVGLINLIAGLSNFGIGITNGMEYGVYFNAYFSIFNLSISVVLVLLLISFLKKIKRLKKERLVHE